MTPEQIMHAAGDVLPAGIGLPRFDSKIRVEQRVLGFAPCWIWSVYLRPDGYGEFSIGGRNGRRVRAHRFAYEQLVGPIPAGLLLDHLCRVRCCVNPDHLEPVTNAVNIRRGDIRRPNNGALERSRTHCPSGHLYAGENLIIRSTGARQCRECKRARDRRRSRAKAVAA